MSEENVELVRRNYEVINSIGRTGDDFVTKVIAIGRSSDVPAELDESDVFWFRDDGMITRVKGYATKEEALEAAGLRE